LQTFKKGGILKKNINLNNNNKMEHLATIGIFFAGLGILLCSFGIFWFTSVYEKVNTPKEEKQ